jgi:hypothetical protein
MFPEIIQVCEEIFKNGSIGITASRFNELTKIESKEIKGRNGNWQENCLKGNLFQVARSTVFFQNRATEQFVREYLNYYY